MSRSARGVLSGGCPWVHPLGDYDRGSASASDAGEAPGAEGGAPRSAYRDAVLADRPVHYLRLEERTGSTAADETGRVEGAYRAVVLGVPGAPEGEDGLAARFETNTSAVVLGDAFDIQTGDAFTLEVWARPAVIDPTYRRMITKRAIGDGSDEGWSLAHSSDKGVVFEAHASGRVTGTNTGVLLAVGTYSHVVVTYGGGWLRLYVDTALIHESAQEYAWWTTPPISSSAHSRRPTATPGVATWTRSPSTITPCPSSASSATSAPRAVTRSPVVASEQPQVAPPWTLRANVERTASSPIEPAPRSKARSSGDSFNRRLL